jgi:hypothetical protein
LTTTARIEKSPRFYRRILPANAENQVKPPGESSCLASTISKEIHDSLTSHPWGGCGHSGERDCAKEIRREDERWLDLLSPAVWPYRPTLNWNNRRPGDAMLAISEPP